MSPCKPSKAEINANSASAAEQGGLLCAEIVGIIFHGRNPHTSAHYTNSGISQLWQHFRGTASSYLLPRSFMTEKCSSKREQRLNLQSVTLISVSETTFTVTAITSLFKNIFYGVATLTRGNFQRFILFFRGVVGSHHHSRALDSN